MIVPPSLGLSFPESPVPPGASYEGLGQLDGLLARRVHRPGWQSAREYQQARGACQNLACCGRCDQPRRPQIPTEPLSVFASFRVSPEIVLASCSFSLAWQRDGIGSLAHRRHPHLPRSTHAIHFEKDLVPREARQAQHQVIELTTRCAAHCLHDPVNNGRVLCHGDPSLVNIRVSQTCSLAQTVPTHTTLPTLRGKQEWGEEMV